MTYVAIEQFSDGTITVPSDVFTTGTGKSLGAHVTDAGTADDVYNMSSITDNGTGNNTHAFVNSFLNILYGGAGGEFWAGDDSRGQSMDSNTIAPGSVVISVSDDANISSTLNYNIFFWGDLA